MMKKMMMKKNEIMQENTLQWNQLGRFERLKSIQLKIYQVPNMGTDMRRLKILNREFKSLSCLHTNYGYEEIIEYIYLCLRTKSWKRL